MLRQSKDREKMCNCMVLNVTAIFFWITAFLKKLPFLAKGLGVPLENGGREKDTVIQPFCVIFLAPTSDCDWHTSEQMSLK